MEKLMTAEEWTPILIAGGCSRSVANAFGVIFADTVGATSFNKGRDEVDDFLGQVLHESAHLTRFEEGLSYSAERLMAVWPTRFKTLMQARMYERKPQLLANYVYAGRMGNVELDDGWRFRGRGPIQLTGRANYAFVGDLIGQDLTVLPELMEQPRYALEATIAWWEDRIPDSMLGDPEKVTKRVNGGLIGLADRVAITEAVERGMA